MEKKRRMTRNSRRFLFFAAIIASLINVFIIFRDTNALNFSGWTSQHITNQSYAQGVYRCYTAKNGTKGGPVYDNSASETASETATQIAQTIHENTDTHVFTYKDLFQMATASDAMLLPNGLAPVVGINCAFLINDFDYTDISVEFNVPFSNTVYERLGVPRSKLDDVRSGGDKKATDAFMTGMGYSVSEDATPAGATSCFKIDYRADLLYYEAKDDDETVYTTIKDVYAGKWNMQLDAKPQIAGGANSAQICVTTGDDGKITEASSAGWVGGAYYKHGGEYLLAYVDPNNTVVHFQIWGVSDEGDHDHCIDYAGTCTTGIFNDDDNPDGSFDAKGMTVEEFKKAFKDKATQIRYTQGIGAPSSDKKYDTLAIAPVCKQWMDQSPASCADPDLWTQTAIGIYVLDVVELTSDAAGSRTWTLTGNGNDALKYISDNSAFSTDLEKKTKAGSSWGGTKITSNEKPLLYQWYMANQSIGRVNVRCDVTAEELELHPEWIYTVEWFNDMNTKLSPCYVLSYDSSATVVLLDSDGHFNTYLSPITDLFNAMHYGSNALTDVDPNDIISIEEAQEAYAASLLPTGKEKENCYSGAGSLSWIICPLIENIGNFVRDKYVDWVEPALQINTLLFGNNDKSPSYMAWNVFRNIANLAFVILFIIVIFSQVTGVGIDNYGIKKILPKLIIGALLINLSYIICQLAIDIANIIGYGIAGIFQWINNQVNLGMPPTIKVEGVVVDPAKEVSLQGVLSDGVAGVGAIVVLIIGVFSLASVLSQGTALVIPILMAVLGVGISFFTLIAILGLRQAAAVLLVVASPLAFVCYMLPNTKKIFDKWFKAFEALLIAFPACSALIYGGDMVARILISTSYGSTWILITAAIISMAPVFFIPRLIRSSMGAISNFMADASHRMSRAARSAGNNSRSAKEIRANHDWNSQRKADWRHAGYKYNRKTGAVKRRWNGSGLYGIGFGRKEKIARAQNAALSNYEEMKLGSRMANEDGVDFLHSQMYAVEGKLNDTAVSAMESRIKLGGLTMTANGEDGQPKEVKVDPSDIDQLKTALVQAITRGEEDKVKALTNILSQKGDKGREAVHGAIETSEAMAQSMDADELNRLKATHSSLASHLMEHFAKDYKDNNRSTYDWAARSQSASESFKRASADDKRKMIAENGLAGRSMSVASVKPATLINMDDKEFERLANKNYDGLKPEDAAKQKAELSRTILVALSSEAAAGAKIERVNELKKLADKLGMVPGPKPPAPTA